MAAPSYTYSLTNGATADAAQVMQNYNDILNGVTDGTKDLTINAITCNGAASFKGTVALGDAAADDITHTGSLASTIPIKTNNTYDIGSATLGLRKLYLGNGGAGSTCDIVSASHATTREYTIPDCATAANFVMSELAQSINGIKTFNSGIVIGTGNATILKYVENTSGSTTWKFDGAGTSAGSASTYSYVISGKICSIIMNIANMRATTSGSGNSVTLIAQTAINAEARPSDTIILPFPTTVSSTPGWLTIGTTGVFSLYKDSSGTGVWSGTAVSHGVSTNQTNQLVFSWSLQ